MSIFAQYLLNINSLGIENIFATSKVRECSSSSLSRPIPILISNLHALLLKTKQTKLFLIKFRFSLAKVELVYPYFSQTASELKSFRIL